MGPCYILGLHSVAADVIKLDKISEGGLGERKRWLRIDPEETHHCPGTEGIKEAAAREGGVMSESYQFSEHQEEKVLGRSKGRVKCFKSY